MVCFDEIIDLQYYNQTPGIDCYCDLLVDPNDLILQAQVPFSPSGQYIVLIQVLQPDGTVIFEDATQYFQWYAFQANNGNYYINMQALRFSPAMCANSCFILKVTISRVEFYGIGQSINRVVFQKYTERYCVDNCCIVATSISINQVPEEIEG
jgi:hypothetical protein